MVQECFLWLMQAQFFLTLCLCVSVVKKTNNQNAAAPASATE
jgi:hypothetical protein